MPATSGTRPPKAWTSVRSTSSFSTTDSVAASPSEPSATMPVQPDSIIHSAWRARNA